MTGHTLEPRDGAWVRRPARVATVGGGHRALVTDPRDCEIRVLEGSALAVWEELTEGTTVAEVIRRVTARYPGDDARLIAAGVRRFLADLEAAGLVEVAPGAAPIGAAPDA